MKKMITNNERKERKKELQEKLVVELTSTFNFNKTKAKKIASKIKGINQLYLLSSLRFLSYTEKVTEPTFTFRFLGTVFTLESLASPKDLNKKRDKVKKYLKKNLTKEEKISLLMNFEFSEPYEYLSKAGSVRHLMFKEFCNDKKFLQRHHIDSPETNYEFCSGNRNPLCECDKWLNENENKINFYIDKFVDILYEIRNSIVHEASHVSIMPLYDEPDIEEYTDYESSLIDAYSLIYKEETEDKIIFHKNYFRVYESCMKPEDFFKIIRNCIKTDLERRIN